MLPSILSDHAVLQRETQAPIWGWETPENPVLVEFRGNKYETQADAQGRWEVQVDTGAAGGPFEMLIRSPGGEVRLRDLLVGEVLIGGGQSNLWWPIESCFDYPQIQAEAEDPLLRLFNTNIHPRSGGLRAETPQRTVETSWVKPHAANIGRFPSTAYFCAKKLREILEVPVGILHFAVPGSSIQPHIAQSFGEEHFPEMVDQWRAAEAGYAEAVAAYETGPLAEWKQEAEAAEAAGQKPRKKPGGPKNPNRLEYGGFFNAMIHPCTPWAARAVIWWQGEGNQSEVENYRRLFPILIRNWRQAWRQPDLPFCYVELANIGPEQQEPVEEETFPAIRDAQKAGLALPDVYLVCALDVKRDSEPVWEIHPKDKRKAGERLAHTLLVEVYDQASPPSSGPLYHDAQLLEDRFEIVFTADEGITASDGEPLRGFAIAGPDREWLWAEARLDGRTVVVSHPDIPKPAAVRYAWANNPIGNLTNVSGQPAAPFRTDDWPLKQK